MRLGFALPSAGPQASVAAIEETAAAAAEGRWDSLWVVDHILVDSEAALERGRILEALMTLAVVAGREPDIMIGIGVLVVPLRNAVVLAKELSSLQALSRGRLIVGVGVGWDRGEFDNLGVKDRFSSRGAYLDEAIALWKHLWSGQPAPFLGRFHQMTDYVFNPLPPVPIPLYIGGESRAALVRACAVGDGYIASRASTTELRRRLDEMSQISTARGTAAPPVTVKLHLRDPAGALRDFGLVDEEASVRTVVHELAAMGVREVILDTPYLRPDEMIDAMRRFRVIVESVPESANHERPN